jgi:transposase
MGLWAKPRRPREQTVMFAPTLDEMVPEDHPVRLYHEVLSRLPWDEWEARYDGHRGQPAIHPMLLAGLILYGLWLGIRSSRKLEDAARNRVDLMWLLEGLTPDHATIAAFRARFKSELKQLSRQFVGLATGMGLIDLGEVAVDATRMGANNSRGSIATAATLRRKAEQLAAELEAGLEELEANDAAESGRGSLTELPRGLQRKAERLARYEQAQAAAEAQDEAAVERRKKKGKRRPSEPDEARLRAVPTTDPESRRLPNKEGGCRPNYTPLVVTEGKHGFIVDDTVNADGNEAGELLGALARVQELRAEVTGSAAPEGQRLLADGAYGTGYHLQELEAAGIDLLAPVAGVSRDLPDEVPQASAGQPLAEAVLAELPHNPSTKRWDRRCFAYDEEQDVYVCPLGEVLRYEETHKVEREGGPVHERIYRCRSCGGCPWRPQCVTERNKKGRTIHRDQYEAYRQRQRAKMATPQAQAAYRRRGPLVETVFGAVKGTMGARQFLLRGKEKVATEWSWLCLAYNVRKLVGLLRAGTAQLPA